MATYELNQKQLVTFLEYTWNQHMLEWHENLFFSILAYEFFSILAYEKSRTFSEGWDYCNSRLEIEHHANGSYSYLWQHTTTLGIELWTWIRSGERSVFNVTIPDDRDQPGRATHSDMQAVLAGHAYWSWSEQQDESNSDAIAAAAFFQGVTVEELLATRKKEEEEREEKKEKRRQFYASNPDSDYEEFDEPITEDSLES